MASLPLNAVRPEDSAVPATPRRRHRTGRSAPSSRVAFGVGLTLVCSLAAGQLLLGGPAAIADTGSVAVADALGVTSAQAPLSKDTRQLGDLVASRSAREADRATASSAQSQAEQTAAAAQAAAQAAVAAAAQAAAQTQAASAAPGSASAGTAATTIAKITNSAGPVKPQTQAAANAVVSNVPGADRITLGGTRASATDPHGHPSGLAVDYMVLADSALAEAIIAYHIAHWNELGVEYLIYRQRMLSAPNGTWVGMADRGSPTANHMDHVHVNYR